jgi:hypothetical protein
VVHQGQKFSLLISVELQELFEQALNRTDVSPVCSTARTCARLSMRFPATASDWRIEQGGEQARQRALELGASAFENRISKRVSDRCSRRRLGLRLIDRSVQVLILHGARGPFPAVSTVREFSMARLAGGQTNELQQTCLRPPDC